MKKVNNIVIPLLMVFLFAGLYSCSEMDEYKEFTEGGEISYTGKMDSIKIYSGRNRIQIEGIITADPKVSEYKIFWNSKKDSIVVPVERSGSSDTLVTLIEGLPENIYNFEIRTYDDLGNSSVPVFATGQVYGSRYQQSLINRPVISNVLIGSNLTVNYASMDLTSGVIGTELDYMSTSGGEETVFVPIDSSYAFIDDFLINSTYNHRTVFLPEPTSIDTFYTDYKSFTPEPKITDPPYFKNACAPFEIGDNSGGRWNTPAEWIHNNAALSHNGYGALDGQLFDLESGWGQPDIINGKVYQSFVLEPGTYAYVIDIKELNYEGADSDKDKGYFTVAAGATLPDVNDVETSANTIAYERINKANGLNRTLIFTIDELQQVSIGVQTTNDKGAGRYLKINSFALGEISEAPELKNSAVPFVASEKDGRWGILEDWISNDAVKNHGGLGGWDEWNGNIFNIESGWGAPGIENGKIYQTMVIPPGTYTFKTNFRMVDGSIDTNHTEEFNDNPDLEDHAYIVVYKGCELPDVNNVETSGFTLGYEKILTGKSPEDFEISFTVENYTQVSLGIVTTQPGGTVPQGGSGRFANITSFEFYGNENPTE